MVLSVEVLNLLLYCVQQLGIMLCVGAATIALITFIVATRDGKVDETEEGFAKAVRKAVWVGLAVVVSSGIIITLIHESSGEGSIVGEPVFIFKWLLIGTLVGAYLLQKGKVFSHFLIEGVIGGTWYTLFLIHILAPLTSWANLLTLYVMLTIAFVAVWSTVVKMTKKKISVAPAQAPAPQQMPLIPPPKPIPVMPTAAPKPPILPPAPKKVILPVPQPPAPVAAIVPKPVVPPPVVVPPPLPSKPPVVAVEMPQPVAAAPAEHHSPWLPAIHIMPKSQKELDSGAHIITIAAKPKTT